MSEAPYHWIKQVEEAVQLTQNIPLWGSPPPFPWEEFSKKLGDTWRIPKFAIKEHRTKWRAKEELLEGIGSHPQISSFSLMPLKGSAHLVMSGDDVGRLAKAALSEQGTMKAFTDKRLQEGFYNFLILEGLNLVNELHSFGDLSASLASGGELPGGALCIDIQAEAQGQPFWARVVCSDELCQSFQSHFVQKPSTFSLELSKALELPLRFEIGSTALSLSKWKSIKQGDILLLDRCTFDPKTKKGSAEIVFGRTPFFRARLKDSGIKILDYAFYFEEETQTMQGPDDEFPKESPEEENDLPPEEEFGEDPQEETPMWEAETPSQASDLEKKISTNEIPLTVTVEVARINMTVEKLLDLQPGNELQLPVHPDQGVQLLINGRRVAKGELIKIGEALGVRILQIGD